MPRLKFLQRLHYWWQQLGPLDPANALSLFRGLLGFGCIFAVSHGGTMATNVIALLITLAMFSDSIDGLIARHYGFGGEIGKLSDLYADHWFALCVWFSLHELGAVSLWVVVLTSGRDTVVDYLRQVRFSATGLNGFDQVRSPVAWLSRSRFMRGLYATLKVAVWIALLLQLNANQFVHTFGLTPDAITTMVWVTVGVCLIRAIPYFNWYPIFPKARPA